MEHDLSGLRDIHLPAAPGFWPPAYGWFLLVLLLAGLAAAAVAWLKYRRRSARLYALKQLEAALAAYETGRDIRLLAEHVSELLKRLALRRFGYRNIGSLTGDAWVAFVRDQSGQTWDWQTAALFAHAPYLPPQEPSSANAARLKTIALSFIQRVA